MRALLSILIATFACADGEPPVPTYAASLGTLSRAVTAEGNLRAVQSTPISPPRVPGMFEPFKLAWIADDGAKVSAGDVVIRFDPTALDRRLKDGESSRTTAAVQLEKEEVVGRAAAAKRDSAAELADLALERTKRFAEKDPEIYSRNQIIEAEVDEGLSVARRAHAVAAKEIERGLTASRSGLAMVAKRRAEMEIERAQAGLSALEVRAPHDGLLVLRRDWRGNLPKAGETVWGGQKLAEIPDLAEMEAEIFVLEVDGAGLKTGTEVTLAIEAQPGDEFAGTIKHVDDLSKERVRGVPVQYFAAVVSLAKTEPLLMKPGQRVRARIELAEEAGVIVPRHAVFRLDDHDVVFVRVGIAFLPRSVELGQASAARVLIKSGLSEGEEIALIDPRGAAKGGSDEAEGDENAQP